MNNQQCPKIDPRTYEEIVEQTENLAQQFSDWKPASDGKMDAGRALIRIFGRMAKLVSDRLDRVPEKNFLAFLDLIGGQLKPPQPAKVPLTFYLAEGSPVDGLVPAYTQVSAPPGEDGGEEIIFETDRELVVTTTQLKTVFVREPSQDKYGDLSEICFTDASLETREQKDTAFLVWKGDRSISHSLYLTCPEIFSLPALPELKLIITSNNSSQLSNLPLNWSYWDGLQWQEITHIFQNNQFIFTNLPIPTASEIQGKTERWLRSSLNLKNIFTELPQINNVRGEIEVTQSNLVPKFCLYNFSSLDLSKDFYPFGDRPEFNDTFYIALDEQFIKPNTIVTININLTHKPVDPNNLQITWEIDNGQGWQEITNNNNEVRWIENSSAIQFTESNNIQAKLQFPNRDNLPPPGTINGETGYWIRARITQGCYGQPSKKRTYTIYNEVVTVNSNSSDRKISILGNATDFFANNDVIRLVYSDSNTDKQEECEIESVGGNTLALKTAVSEKARAKGTTIYRRDSISETIFATYDPPLIKSLTLTYKFTLTENAIYFAENDRNYAYPENFNTQLMRHAKSGDKLLTLEKVAGLAVGEFLTINSENYQIESIDREENRIGLTTKLNQNYSSSTPVSRSFRPFTPTIDREPTVYLGFDRAFDNKTITLYAQVESPLPDEIAIDLTTETILTEAANIGQTTIKLADLNGWRIGDNIELQNPSNAKQYTKYTISNIDDNRLTISPPLQQNYDRNNLVIYSKQPKLVWEYFSTLGWQTLAVKDETKAFSQRGLIQFIAPADFSQTEIFSQQLYWLRIRWQSGNFPIQPSLRRILTNTTWAIQATTIEREILGSSNFDLNQVFFAKNTPILMGQKLEVREEQIPSRIELDRVTIIRDEVGKIEEIWVLWQEVADFYSSSASDRHYTLDRQTGEIRFGDGQTGMIPPRGRNNIRLSFYRTGGGKRGNIASQTINQLKTTIPYIDRVINLEPSAGGTERESLEHLKERVPKQLRHRDRAVTHEDIADLAYEASTDVARVKVIPPDLLTTDFSCLDGKFWLDPSKAQDSFNGKTEEVKNIMEKMNNSAGQVILIILPYSSDRQPTPSLALLEEVETYIRSRCQATMDLVVTSPQWQEVTVTTTITPVSFDNADIVRNTVKQRLENFLHPLTGGKGEGWQFGRYPQRSDFYALIQSIPGVDRVDFLEVIPSPETNLSSLTANTLIYSGNHVVNVLGNRNL
jgi:uncharacterized phage protein gp47/JayE